MNLFASDHAHPSQQQERPQNIQIWKKNVHKCKTLCFKHTRPKCVCVSQKKTDC